MTLNTGVIPETAPEMSPFSSSIVELRFKDSVTLAVHRAYLDGRPTLSPAVLSAGFSGSRSRLVGDMKDTPIDVGHVLVKWLYTGTYQPLDKNPSPQAALKTAFGVYSLSRRYDLPELEWLAALEISRLKTDVEIASLLDIIEEAYPQTIGEDTWMESFLALYIKDAMERVKSAPPAHDPKADIENVPITKLIVKSLLGACGEAMRDVAAREAALAEGSSEFNPGASTKEERATPRKEKRHQAQKGSNLFNTIRAGFNLKQPVSTETETTFPDNSDWVMPSPQPSDKLEAQPELAEKVKKPKKPKKKKEPIVEPEPEPEAALPQDPEPEAALPQDPEQDPQPEAALLHELEPEATPAQDTDLAEENAEVWGHFSVNPPEASPIKKEEKASKLKETKPKKKKKVAPVAELEHVQETELQQPHEYIPEQDLEFALEPEPVVEQEVEPGPVHVAMDDGLAAPIKVKKHKKKKKEKTVVAEVPEETRVEEEVAIFTPVQDWDR